MFMVKMCVHSHVEYKWFSGKVKSLPWIKYFAIFFSHCLW